MSIKVDFRLNYLEKINFYVYFCKQKVKIWKETRHMRTNRIMDGYTQPDTIHYLQDLICPWRGYRYCTKTGLGTCAGLKR